MRLPHALGIAAAVVLADQASKAWIVATVPYGSETEVIPGLLRLVHSRNRGIAFGFFGSSGPAAQLVLLAVVAAIVAFVGWQLLRSDGNGLAGAGLALVLGGAVGNIVDRIVRGEVVDFLDFFLTIGGREHHWFAFNVADSAISVGAACVIVSEIVNQVRSKRASRPD
ncbi:MAG: signal peptidase II [Thermoanaerobaculaceae bacterium]|nr:signal peptidase II [Thermoanaerobaculaceae bacterium]TAM48544.1 MAG: signal peptidase II [Acidobacteriota bacterium]